MAGIQSCFRKYLIFSSARLINKNGIIHQSSRRRHYLISQISSPKARVVFQAKKFSKTNTQLLFRLASTNVTTPKEAVSDAPKNEAKTEADRGSSEVANVQSTDININFDESTLPPVPELELTEPPDMEFISMALKEPSFYSLGLGSLWPPGIIQQIFEYLHINLDLPWWQAILLVTVTIKLAMFPLTLKIKRETVVMMNSLPQIAKMQEKITEAKLRSDPYAVAAQTQELSKYIKDNGIKMFGFLRNALIQGPIFISMYYALSGMAKTPVESLKTGGLFWFKDLTQADPFYILPVALSTTLFVIIQIGAEGTSPQVSTPMTKWFLRSFPLIALFFSINCFSCVTWYWTVSNMVTLFLAAIMKVPVIKSALNVPDVIPQARTIGKKKQGFVAEFKEGIENMKISHKIQERERLGMMDFQKAGSGPVPRTFKKNPLLEKAK